MAANRFEEMFQAVSPSMPASMAGFVPCPLPFLAAAQQQFIQEVYRIARERTEAELRPPVRRAVFSMN